MKIKKLKSKKNPLSYFSSTDIPVSPAEQIIIYILDKHNIPYIREVSFKGFTSPKGGYYRYDFYFPKKNLIIEYDGKNYHRNGKNDNIKNIFCRNNGINIIRFNSKHYYHLEKELLKIFR